MKYRKPPTESAIAEWLKAGQITLSPLLFNARKLQPSYSNNRTWDFEVEGAWGDQMATFAVEYKSLSTPKIFEEALRFCLTAKLPSGFYPLILMPYLRSSQLDVLERNNISGIDLCGNGVVIIPNKLRVYRMGEPNQFLNSSPIKNIYRKNSSMVARTLLTNPRFSSALHILDEVNRRNVLACVTGSTRMTLGTISKVMKQLEDELIIERREGVSVLQPERLLDKLAQNYEPLKSIARVRLKIDCPFDRLSRFLTTKLKNVIGPQVATGLSSVSRYAVMEREEILSLYCPQLKPIQLELKARESDRFANLELIETDDQPLYFDATDDDGFRWASPVQTYLELMCGDKRDRETAEQVREHVLDGFKKGD